MWAGEYNTDGTLPGYVLNVLAVDAGIPPDEAGAVADKLVEVGLWERTPDGWDVHDWTEWQATAEERDRRTLLNRERQRRWAERQRREAEAKAAGGLTRYSRVSDAPLTPTDTDADTEEENLKETCRVDPPNADPSHAHPVEVPPTGGRAQPPDDGFAQFWDTYPKRNGRKVNKAPAQALWRKLKPADRDLALTAVANYAAERGGPDQTSAADAHRWLRDKAYIEWAEPPDETPAGRDRRALTARLAALSAKPAANRRGA